tara:strand:+ start:793 stop:918 length:126 start_codon:yes stop_codon:yes gene_type:complete
MTGLQAGARSMALEMAFQTGVEVYRLALALCRWQRKAFDTG